ncbi:A24 family peptidase [Patescibacteria group bacterium]|nr:A24 family peptidase [Patescibacteria group bacterium]
MFLVLLLAFLFGLSVGSFLNVVILRYHKADSDSSGFAFHLLRGRSHCPHCKKTLGFWELIPVLSFLMQGGRCQSCRKPISWQYPLVELATGVVFALIVWQYMNGAI